MGWSGITVFWMRHGQNEDDAKVELLGGSWDGDDGDFVERDIPPAAPEQLAATEKALELLRRTDGLEELANHSNIVLAKFLDDTTELIVYDTNLTVLPAPSYDGEFEPTWVHIRRLAALAPNLIWDIDYDDVYGIDDLRGEP